MSRRVLLIEPNYKNKYIPLNLLKLSWYFRVICKDDVRFYKGDLKQFAAQLLLEEFFASNVDRQNLFAPEVNDAAQKFGRHTTTLLEFIRTGKSSCLNNLLGGDFYLKMARRPLSRLLTLMSLLNILQLWRTTTLKKCN